jgi:hypothetical protein
MEVIVIIGVFLLVVFVYMPASGIARWIYVRQGKLAPGEIDSEKTNKLTFFLCILVYLFLWWLLEITGLRALIAKEFE